MAVYKRTYKGYHGPLTPDWSRLLIIPRYAWSSLFQQKAVPQLFGACFLFTIGCALVIYLNANMGFLAQYMPMQQKSLLDVGNKFFFMYTSVQCSIAFLLAAFIGPGLISSDLANNALPLYFCRPLSRIEYITGKAFVIAGLLSLVTWIPGLLLFGLQAAMTDGWFKENYWIAGSIVASCGLWILVITMLALALSAWVRWRIVAGALMLVVMFLGAGIAQTIKAVTRSDWGAWFDIANNTGRVWVDLFRISDDQVFSLEEAVAALLLTTLLCIYALAKRVRAYEVVR